MKPGTKTITFRISPELYEKIVDAANNEERSVNNFVTYVVKEYIQNNSKSEKNKGRD